MTPLGALLRAIAYIAATLMLMSALQAFLIFVVGWHPLNGWWSRDFLISDGAGFVAALITATIAARLEKRRMSEYGLPLIRSAAPRFIEGFVWGALAPAAIMALVVAFGGAKIDGFALHGAELVRTALLALAAMIVLGLLEEFVFRGYPLDALARGAGFWPAAVALSVGFGLLHYFSKPMEDWIDAATVSLIALFFCFTIRRTGNLWFAAGMHAAFDFVALYVLGAPNTGNRGEPLPERLLATRFTGPPWMTGGPRGLEASLFAFAVIALLFALFAQMKKDSRKAALFRSDVMEVD